MLLRLAVSNTATFARPNADCPGLPRTTPTPNYSCPGLRAPTPDCSCPRLFLPWTTPSPDCSCPGLQEPAVLSGTLRFLLCGVKPTPTPGPRSCGPAPAHVWVHGLGRISIGHVVRPQREVKLVLWQQQQYGAAVRRRQTRHSRSKR